MTNRELAVMSLEQLYATYLMASYLYYETNTNSPLPDIQFDFICRRLLEGWDDLNHVHKHLCSINTLECKTGYGIAYPTIVKQCAKEWRDEQISSR